MKITSVLLFLVAVINVFADTGSLIDRLVERIEDLKFDLDDAEIQLEKAEKLQELYQFMTTDPKNKTQREWDVIERKVGSYSLDSSELKAGTQLMISFPRNRVDDLINVWAKKYDIPHDDAVAMKVEALAEQLLKDQIKAKRFAFTKGQGGEVSSGKMVTKRRNDESVDICFALETFKFDFTMEKVSIPKSSTKCGYFLFWKTSCKTSSWVEFKPKHKTMTQKEQMDLADYMDHRLSARFTSLYRNTVNRQDRSVRRLESKVKGLQKRIDKYQEKLDKLEDRESED